jgi:hypothetical protein
MREQIRHLLLKSKNNLSTLNTFPSVPPSIDEHDLRNQRISTRLFIFLLILLMTILLLYTSLITVAKTITKEEPSFTQYVHLNSTHSSTLTCPCSKISINYEKFVRIDYTLHQVCNSTFVNQSWIDYLAPPIGTPIFVADTQWTIASAFQALRILCHLINDTIFDSLVQFYSNQYVSASTVPQQLLESEIKSFVDKFRSSKANSFSLSYLMIRETTQANGLFSALFTNRLPYINKDTNSVLISTFRYDGCKCSSSSTCAAPFYMSKHSIGKSILFYVPGFYIGCYVIEALLQSTLECFYDQECIDQLQSFIFWSSSGKVTALNASLSSVYSINSTIKDLIATLMIEEWNVSTIYETYYNECHPTQCTYKLETTNDIIYIITTLFGIAGGLITVLKIVVPRLVKLFVRKKTQQQQQQPTTSKIEIEN